MSDQKKYYRLGIFVLLSLLIGLGLLVGLGAGKWFSSNSTLETYFDESIQGIDIGSKIRYRGVVVGEVSEIGFTHTHYELDLPASQRHPYVMVTAKVQHELFGSKSITVPDQETLNREAKRGLRIKLTPQGLTGTSYLEIDFTDPAENPPLPISWQPNNLYLPAARSTVRQFVDGAQDAMVRLQRIDIEGTFTRLNRLMETTEQKISAMPLENIGKNIERFSNDLAQAPVSQLTQEAQALLAEVRNSNQALHNLVADPALASAPADLALAARRAREIMENPQLNQAVNHLNQSLGRIDRLVGSREQEISALIDNLRDVSVTLKGLTESVENNPTSLFLGAPAKPYEPPR